MNPSFTNRFDQNIFSVFRGALRVSLKDTRFFPFFIGAIRRQNAAAKRRNAWETRGLRVPPLMIASLTNRCNLNCKGCYARAHRRSENAELKNEEWIRIIGEAEEMGVSLVMLAGGEPFLRPELLDITERFPKLIFPVFTNGLVLTDPILSRLKKQKQVIPVVSLEGFEKQTDGRRGAGVYERLQKTLALLKRHRLFYGISVTVNRDNFAQAMDHGFIRTLLGSGCRLFFFIEYTPVEEGTDHLVLTDSQRVQLRAVEQKWRPVFPGIFIVFPGDEEQYGGCLAAGRGFVHVAPDGGLEPCPFAPYSDINLRNLPFREALRSELLEKIRRSHGMLNETRGGCALWNNREWVRGMLQNGQVKGKFEWRGIETAKAVGER